MRVADKNFLVTYEVGPVSIHRNASGAEGTNCMPYLLPLREAATLRLHTPIKYKAGIICKQQHGFMRFVVEHVER